MPHDFLEKTLEDIVFENRKTIHMRGLDVFMPKAFRQVILPSGKRIDILGFNISDGHLKYDLYELKRDYINIESVCQAYNYVEEINHLIKGSFKTCEASIIMVGKRYDSLSILNAISIPVHVFTYDYKVDGIWFDKKHHSRAYFPRNEHFSLGLLAWGSGMLALANGDVSSISFHSSIQRHLDGGNFEQILRQKKSDYLTEVEIIATPQVAPARKIEILTEVFPPQPSWSVEFAIGIPYEDFFDEFEFEIDDSDFEPEEIEDDMADYELNGDSEPDNDEEWVERVLFEPINFEGWSLSTLILPELYYSPKLKN